MDDPFSKQTEEKFNIVGDSKAIATWHVDQLSRKMCPNLEYFVVFSSIICAYGNIDQTNYGFANSVMERICENRRSDGLPALAIQWGPVGGVGVLSDVFESNPSAVIGGCGFQEIKSCLETLDCLMKHHYSIISSIIVGEKQTTDSDIVTKISNAMGIKDLEAICLTWTLPELGMDSILGLEIKQIFETEFNTFFTSEELQSMTFAKLIRLKENKNNASIAVHEQPIQLHHLNSEEMWVQPILRIPFIDGEIQEPTSVDETPTVFVFPGIEGLALAMESLAKNLHFQVLCFQYYFDTDERQNVIQSMCEYFSSIILEKLRPEQEFHFIGYSLGALIAVETAKILENRGRKGHIWLIDGSPKTVKMLGLNRDKLEENVPLEDDEIQNRICFIFITTLLPKLPKEKYSKNIEKSVDWESKKKITSSMFSSMMENENLMHRFLDKLFNIIKATHTYEISPVSLNSSCVLIRCVKNLYGLPFNESYSLAEHFINPVEVYRIDEVDHSSIPSHPKTAEIIMKSPVWKS
ncbi:fatty acid synthase-like [Planococcus citri]|uniref:fatty acid synthase-like n=1 Tax=Planococcus citri TaxID=170843 RepID=UPI0031F89BA3